MTNESILLLVLIILLLGALPSWSYSSSWGYGPTGALTVLLIVLLVWTVASGRPFFRSTADDLKVTAQDAGHDLQSAGRDAASNIRSAVQQ